MITSELTSRGESRIAKTDWPIPGDILRPMVWMGSVASCTVPPAWAGNNQVWHGSDGGSTFVVFCWSTIDAGIGMCQHFIDAGSTVIAQGCILPGMAQASKM